MKFIFSGTQKVDTDGNDYFIYKGVNLMACQDKWFRPNNEFLRLTLFIYEDNKKFEPYIYNLEDDNQILTFAAGEISNGVWGFALPE